MIFIVFAMAKEELSSSKTCIITISSQKSTTDDQISKIFSLSCTAMDLMTETVNLPRESPPQFFLLLGVKEYRTPAHYIERCPRLWSMNFIQQKKDAQHNSPYLVQLRFKLQHKSEDRAIRKNTTSCKQHLKSRAERQNIHSRTKKRQTKTPWFVVIQIQAFQSEKTKEAKIFIQL